MTILEAAQVISKVSHRYTSDKLAVTWVGAHYASLNNAGMTEAERKGAWQIVKR